MMVGFKKVSKEYRAGDVTVKALRDITLEIPQGSFTALVGPSGSGKTTALNLIGCLDYPEAGEVVVAGESTRSMNAGESAKFRGEKLGFIFQDFNLLPVLTVFENVEYPLLMIRNTPREERKRAVTRVLAAVGMEDQARKYPTQLSGGQKQRVAIARALVGNPLLVVADEPTANLDGHTAQNVLELMKKIRDEFGTTFVFSTHDRRIMDQAETIFYLEDGRLRSSNGAERRAEVDHD